MAKIVRSRVSIGICIGLLLGPVQAPAAQSLESEARRARARKPLSEITHAHVRGNILAREAVFRGFERGRLLAEARDRFDAELDSLSVAAASGRLQAENVELEDANRQLRKAIAAAKDRKLLGVVRMLIRIPVTIVVTAATGSPIIGAAAGSVVSTTVTGGSFEEVVTDAAISTATAGAFEVAGMGIKEVAKPIAEQAAARTAEELAAKGVPEVLKDKITAEVAKRTAAKWAGAIRTGVSLVPKFASGELGTLDGVLTGVNLAITVNGLATPVKVDMEAVMELDVAALDLDDPDVMAELVERGRSPILLAANTAGCGQELHRPHHPRIHLDGQCCVNCVIGPILTEQPSVTTGQIVNSLSLTEQNQLKQRRLLGEFVKLVKDGLYEHGNKQRAIEDARRWSRAALGTGAPVRRGRR